MAITNKITIPNGNTRLISAVEPNVDILDILGTGYQRGTFTASDEYNTANDNATSAKNALDALGEFAYVDQAKLDEYTSKYENRDKFSYDFNTDALYQQYKDKYIKQAKMASADVMGQAAAMTGGYGSSYAQTVGNQAYQSSLEQLNDVIPELYQLAYDKYNQEGQDLLNMISLLKGEKEFAYGQYNDEYTRHYNDMTYWTDEANAIWNRDYAKFTDEEDYKYATHRDSVEDAQWEKDHALSERQLAMEEEAWNLQKAEYEKSIDSTTYSGKGTTKTGTGYDNGSYSDAVVKQAQAFVGASADGKWGPNSTAAAKAAGYNSLADVVKAMGDSTGDLSNVSSKVIKNVQNYTTLEGQANYLASQGIEGEQAYAILDQYGVVPLTERSWEMVDDGGINWFWGADNNAVVRDENGNEYTIKELEKELKKTMSNKEAKDYIKKLQKKLGI